jgi:hypothetical protein
MAPRPGAPQLAAPVQVGNDSLNKIILAHIAAIVAALSAGGAVVAMRSVIGQTDPVSLALYRYVIALICLFRFCPSSLPGYIQQQTNLRPCSTFRRVPLTGTRPYCSESPLRALSGHCY